MVGDGLGVILRPPERLDPARGDTVLVGSDCAWNLAVGDVPNEKVPERVLHLSGDGRASLATEKLLAL